MKDQRRLARLLVEGKDDKHSIIHLMRKYGVDWDAASPEPPFVQECGGVPQLLDAITVAVKSYPFLGVVVDADTELAARWAAVSNKLLQVGVQATSPAAGGLIVDHPLLKPGRVGVWVMPDNQTSGMLEDFLSTLVPEGDRCWKHACSSTESACALGARLPPRSHIKGYIHTWLAWQEEPGTPLGQAITAAYLSGESAVTVEFQSWFKRLFQMQ